MATGEIKFRSAAEEAFEYERSLYDPNVRNWRDLRVDPLTGQTNPASFVVFWCHGAPGIAVSRMLGHEVTGNIGSISEAKIALETTMTSVNAELEAGSGNYSLCHGLAGNAEIILSGLSVVGGRAFEVTRNVALTGIDRHVGSHRTWPGGLHPEVTPGLFLGLSGIGLFYLRLFNPAVRSVLGVPTSPPELEAPTEG